MHKACECLGAFFEEITAFAPQSDIITEAALETSIFLLYNHNE